MTKIDTLHHGSRCQFALWVPTLPQRAGIPTRERKQPEGDGGGGGRNQLPPKAEDQGCSVPLLAINYLKNTSKGLTRQKDKRGILCIPLYPRRNASSKSDFAWSLPHTKPVSVPAAFGCSPRPPAFYSSGCVYRPNVPWSDKGRGISVSREPLWNTKEAARPTRSQSDGVELQPQTPRFLAQGQEACMKSPLASPEVTHNRRKLASVESN